MNTVTASLIVLLVLLYCVYSISFPKPIPGIPYNQAASKTVLGDYPDIKEHINRGLGYRDWLGKLSQKHNSPLVQVFLAPFTRPCVVLSDYREAFDILTRRGREFDRSARTAATVRAIVPESLITMTTSDPRFKGNKELVRDLMTPGFLNEVSAPSIYEKTANLISIWRLKIKLAQGRPFEAFADLHDGALDIIMAVTFGSHSRDDVMSRQVRFASSVYYRDVIVPISKEEPAIFPREPLSPGFEGVLAAKEAMRIGFSSPFPYAHIWFLKKVTKLGKSFATKDRMIRDEIHKAVKRLDLSSGTAVEQQQNLQCAMDYMILREVSAAAKEKREPNFDSGRLRDELFLYILGGHDTTATTLAWTVKAMTDVPGPQHMLRQQLHAAFPDAKATGRQPTVFELLTVPAPYLDAFLEEALRYTRTISLLLREALADTQILGYKVPKGTTLIINTRSLSFMQPGLDIPEELRSGSSRAAKDNVGMWHAESIGKFEPMRWLRKKEKTQSVENKDIEASITGVSFVDYEFNPNAGPALTLGAGPRGCAGRKLAYMELRIVIALLVWNFKFEACPAELSSYDVTEYFTTVPKQCFVRLREVE